MIASNKAKKVLCPICGTLCEFNPHNNPFRPFCSQRCQIVDLGQWGNEEYAIPDNSTLPNDKDFSLS